MLVRILSPKLIEIANRSPLRYCSEAQPGPCNATTGILNSRQQLHSLVEQLQYLLVASCCRFLLSTFPRVGFPRFRSLLFVVVLGPVDTTIMCISSYGTNRLDVYIGMHPPVEILSFTLRHISI